MEATEPLKTLLRPKKLEPNPVLVPFSADALILELRVRRKDLSAEQHNELIGIGLNLCSTCMAQIRNWMPAHGWGLVQFVRRHLWRWLRSWPHGNGCPEDS